VLPISLLAFLVGLAVIGDEYIGFVCSHKRALESQEIERALKSKESERFKSEFIPGEFSGEITYVNSYWSDDCMFFHVTYLTSSGESHGQAMCIQDNPSLASFVQVGDSIIKSTGNAILVFKNKSGDKMDFEVKCCDY
jgi:hypothetical protein